MLAVGFVARVGHAEGVPAEVAAPAQAAPATTTPADPPEPHADRVVLTPTAYTHPRGTFFVSNYDLVLLQVGYAPTDRTQVSFTATPPIGEEDEARFAFLDLTLKSALVKDGPVRVAALGSMSGLAGDGIGLVMVGRAGAVVQLCLRAQCTSSLAISSNLALLGPLMVLSNGVGAIFRVGRRVSILLEANTVIPIGREGGQINAFAVGGGVRLHWRRFAADLAILGGVGSTDGVLPIVALTYRGLP